MVVYSGNCGQRGRPDHDGCRSLRCQCDCGHPWRSEMAKQSGNVLGFGGGEWDNKDGPSRAVSATRPGPDPLPFATNERG